MGLDGDLHGFCGICRRLGVDGLHPVGVGGVLACGGMDQLGILCGGGFQKLAGLADWFAMTYELNDITQISGFVAE